MYRQNYLKLKVYQGDNFHSISPDSPLIVGDSYSQQSVQTKSDDSWIDYHVSDLKSWIINSEAYQSAKRLFETSSEVIWLQRLELIPTKYAQPEYTTLDSWGWSNAYDDAMRAAYDAAMQDIYSLVETYQQHVNSLPVTQQKQAAAAGFNLAIGGNLSGSELGSTSNSIVPSSMPSTNPADVFSSMVAGVSSFAQIFTASANVASAINTISKVNFDKNLAKNTFKTNLSNYFRSAGYADAADQILLSDVDLTDFYNAVSSDPTNKKLHNQQLISYLQTVGLDEQFIESYTTAVENNSSGELTLVPNIQQLLTDSAAPYISDGRNVNDVLDDLMKYKLHENIMKLRASYFQTQYSADLSEALDGSVEGEAQNVQNEYKKSQMAYDKEAVVYKLKVLKKWMNDYEKMKDPIAKRLLYESIMNISSDSLFIEQVSEFSNEIFEGDMTVENFFKALLVGFARL